MRSFWAGLSIFLFTTGSSFCQDRVDLQWMRGPPKVELLPSPCPCFFVYLAAPSSRAIIINKCSSAVAGVAVREPAPNRNIPALARAPNREFADVSLGSAQYAAIAEPRKLTGFYHVSCPAMPDDSKQLLGQGPPLCVHLRFRYSTVPVYCAAEGRSLGQSCNCELDGVQLRGTVQVSAPAPLN